MYRYEHLYNVEHVYGILDGDGPHLLRLRGYTRICVFRSSRYRAIPTRITEITFLFPSALSKYFGYLPILGISLVDLRIYRGYI